jgi:carboxypeptidase Taq
MADLNAAYRRFVETLRTHADIASALRLLEWDHETYLPAGATESRARQIGTLASVLHAHQTDPRFLDLVDGLAAEQARLPPEHAVDVRETKWRMDRTRVLDGGLVQERAALHAQGHATWQVARERDNFDQLAPLLARIVSLERQVAAAIGPDRDPYDVLLEEYEPGASSAQVATVFATLRAGLRPLLDRLRARLDRAPLASGALCGDFPIERQRHWNRSLAARLGFDFRRGRLDEAVHPFSTTIGADVRITTRYDARDLRHALFSTVHETGHALYEQGLDPELRGTPRGEACSLAIHESQSRLWENQVARSPGFWRAVLPDAAATFPSLTPLSLDAALLAVNAAQPSLIRTEADELTYNLHILLRFDLERALLSGALTVPDLPAAWRDGMYAHLGISPDTDRDGVLQDVHWASGAIGYFPTYTLGNLYAAQLMAAAESALGALDDLMARGEFQPLLDWLRAHVHRWGQTYRAPQLIEHACGRPPDPQPLLDHLARKMDYLDAH